MKVGDLVYDTGIGLMGLLVGFNPGDLFPWVVMFEPIRCGDVYFYTTSESQIQVISSACNTEAAVV